jgi:hypothetical protein
MQYGLRVYRTRVSIHVRVIGVVAHLSSNGCIRIYAHGIGAYGFSKWF